MTAWLREQVIDDVLRLAFGSSPREHKDMGITAGGTLDAAVALPYA